MRNAAIPIRLTEKEKEIAEELRSAIGAASLSEVIRLALRDLADRKLDKPRRKRGEAA